MNSARLFNCHKRAQRTQRRRLRANLGRRAGMRPLSSSGFAPYNKKAGTLIRLLRHTITRTNRFDAQTIPDRLSSACHQLWGQVNTWAAMGRSSGKKLPPLNLHPTVHASPTGMSPEPHAVPPRSTSDSRSEVLRGGTHEAALRLRGCWWASGANRAIPTQAGKYPVLKQPIPSAFLVAAESSRPLKEARSFFLWLDSPGVW